MPDKKKQANLETPIDQLTKEELDERRALTLQHLDEIEKLWPGLRRKSEDERRSSPGRSLGVFAGPLGLLFAALAPKKGETPPIAAAFDVLGAQDDGQDPERFEAELLARRLYRAETEQKVLDRLDHFARHMGDDILDVGERVIGPGLLALSLARTVAKARPEFATLLNPTLDAFRGLTKQARKALDEKRAAKEGGVSPK